ncbi:MAG: cell division protein SepF [Christensenellaceae bacterium]|jgi:FtsZ-interacting cell division protein YlmF|nr:cell division protein SepF [Christensenellaceae bacterium]
MNWVTKGFSTERRPTKGSATEPIQQEQEFEQELAPIPNPQSHAAAVLFNYDTPTRAVDNQGFNSAFQGGTIGNRHILIISPKTDVEVIAIVDHLKTNEAVIVNFEGIPVNETQRRIDFLSGVACGLGGTIKPLDTHKFIMTPSGIGVKN